MTELFPNVSQFTRDITMFWINQAKNEKDVVRAMQMLRDCRDTMITEEDKDYFDFSISCLLNG